MASEQTEPVPVADCAQWLVRIMRDLQSSPGLDPLLVKLEPDGVTLTEMRLSDELYLIACSLDFDAVMAMNEEAS